MAHIGLPLQAKETEKSNSTNFVARETSKPRRSHQKIQPLGLGFRVWGLGFSV